MAFKDKLLDPAAPVTLFEMVPPPAGHDGAVERLLEEAARVRDAIDAFNLPEIHDESRPGERGSRFVPRLDPHVLGSHFRRALGAEVVANHCVVYQPEPLGWFREAHEQHGIEHVVLVGGEASHIQYPGPGVLEAAAQLTAAGLPVTLGGITIPSRLHEPERIRRKHAAGLRFFTTQVLFDSNDVVWLIQKLNGLEGRIFLSFAPVTQARDIEFLRWLGADVPANLDRYLLRDDPTAETACFERSLDLAQRILMDVFDNLPPDPPAIGLNVEHINRRNMEAAVRMVERLRDLYAALLAAHVRAG